MRLPLNRRGAALILGAVLAGAAGPEGNWLTQDGGGVIAIAPCAGGLCGRIAGMREIRRSDSTLPIDTHGHPKCGLTILHAAPDGPGNWSGLITNPDTGSDWHATFHLDDAGRLLLRGYVLLPMFGETQTWTRYPGTLGTDCAMPR